MVGVVKNQRLGQPAPSTENDHHCGRERVLGISLFLLAHRCWICYHPHLMCRSTFIPKDTRWFKCPRNNSGVSTSCNLSLSLILVSTLLVHLSFLSLLYYPSVPSPFLLLLLLFVSASLFLSASFRAYFFPSVRLVSSSVLSVSVYVLLLASSLPSAPFCPCVPSLLLQFLQKSHSGVLLFWR